MDYRIENAILFISKNHKVELVLDDLAKEVGLSKFHFHRLFKAETGLTPTKYINKIKMEYAAHFLFMYPESKQLEVAFESGYSSPAVFSRAFKQYYGKTPIAFRKERISNFKTKKQISSNRPQMAITYLQQKKIQVEHSNLLEKNLSKLYKKLILKNSLTSRSIGFFIDTPIHTSLIDARYYAGLEEEKTTKTKAYFDIEEGYYTYFTIVGDFDTVNQQIVAYKENFIDPSPYHIASLIGFEKIKLPKNPAEFDYFKISRTIYLKIKR